MFTPDKVPSEKTSFPIWNYVVTTVAIGFSAVSLWVAIATEDANSKMVAAASWPFLQISSSNAAEGSMQSAISLTIQNVGVGPAKLETFEVFWKKSAVGSSRELLEKCCAHNQGGVTITGRADKHVLRAGEDFRFFRYELSSSNGDSWHAFDRVRYSELTYRACYCSVFEECWESDLASLHPRAVKTCPTVASEYSE